ncbi:MAG TPA: hypothetical protein VFJ02_08650 [Vicinamibacterales bacterium]|nr:hypothetical protein [Vicinamibacterales bacterium]
MSSQGLSLRELPPSIRNGFILLAFSALAIVWTWPVAAHLTSRIPHDAGDPILNIWILWWNAHAMPLTEAWWNPPMMWPMPGAMALSEHLLGVSIVATPVQHLGGGPIAAYNVCLLLTYALSGFFGYLLVQRLTGSVVAGICSGLAFGFSPYRAGQLAHIQVLSAQWMPLALLGMHAYVSSGRARWLALFAAAWLLQGLSNGYYLLFFPVLIALWLLWFVDWKREPRRGLALVGTFAIASAPLLPILLRYYDVHRLFGLRRAVSDIRQFSATATSFLHPAPLLRFWPEGPAPNSELYLFPGAVVLIVALAGVVAAVIRKEESSAARSPIAFYLVAALAMGVLALGPGGEGNAPALTNPYRWLLFLPGYDGIRAPSRFMMLASLCLSIVAGLGVAQLARVTWRGRWRATAAALVMAGITIDGVTEPVLMLTPPGRIDLPAASPAPAVLELPIDDPQVSIAAMYRSMFHELPLVNGYSGHFPPHYNILTLALARSDTSVLTYLAERRPLAIIVHDRHDPGREYRKMVEAIPGLQLHSVGAGSATFVLPPQGAPPRAPAGAVLDASARTAGRRLLELDLGARHRVSSLEFALGTRYPDLAPRIRVETSDDGQAWNEVWLGWTGGLALEGVLLDPKLVPVRIPLPDAPARYVRLYPASDWMLQELKARGE